MVGSTIPCEGSRTGFYTDDYNEQDYKSPEEIRKACLCGADLRGAPAGGDGLLSGRPSRREIHARPAGAFRPLRGHPQVASGMILRPRRSPTYARTLSRSAQNPAIVLAVPIIARDPLFLPVLGHATKHARIGRPFQSTSRPLIPRARRRWATAQRRSRRASSSTCSTRWPSCPARRQRVGAVRRAGAGGARSDDRAVGPHAGRVLRRRTPSASTTCRSSS